MKEHVITPDWPAPASVQAVSTTRRGGASCGPWAGLNLGAGSGDDSRAVEENRAQLRKLLPSDPGFPDQVHGTRVVSSSQLRLGDREADAVVASAAGEICAVLTADCLPVLFCDLEGTTVAAAHAGWRGLAAGVLEQAVAAMKVKPDHLLAWLGPAIGPDHYEVGQDVYDAFLGTDPGNKAGFKVSGEAWHADLFMLARLALGRAGVGRVFGGGVCTACDPERFYSYRRDGVTGRMASLVWLRTD